MKHNTKTLFSVSLALTTLLVAQPLSALPTFDRDQDPLSENLDRSQSIADYYRRRRPIPHSLSPSLDMSAAQAIANAEEMRDRLILDLLPDSGPIVGYKAGLTSPPAQTRFGVDHPLRGVLLHDMLLDSGATISSTFGARPLFEPDLIVRVGSPAINQATTRQEVLAALESVIPFIELPDLMFAPGIELDATDLIAVNVGARLGIMGTEIPLATPPLAPDLEPQDWVEILANIEVDMVAGSAEAIADGGGTIIASGNSQALLGHPLDVVLWLVEDLKRSGQCLRPGDLLSLGSITAPMPVIAGQTIEARYQLREERMTVQVTFEPLP